MVITMVIMMMMVVIPILNFKEGIWWENVGQFQKQGNQKLLALYDINKDSKTDILTLSRIQTKDIEVTKDQLNLYLWQKENKKLSLVHKLEMGVLKIYSLLIWQINKDIIKIIICYKHLIIKGQQQKLQNQHKLDNQILQIKCKDTNNCQFINGKQIKEINGIDQIEPTLIMLQGSKVVLFMKDNISKILKYNIQKSQYQTKQLQYYINQKDIKFRNSFYGDYDGDCIPDLILSTNNNNKTELQFIKGTNKSQLKLIKIIYLQFQLIHFSIIDINFDGRMDLIMLRQDGIIEISYNKLYLHHEQQLCSEVVQFPYDFQLIESSISKHQRIQLQIQIYQKSTLLFGDYNNDGYPDLIINSYNTTILWSNQPCQIDKCGIYNKQFINQFAIYSIRTFTKHLIPNLPSQIIEIVFFDFYQDGHLDFLITIIDKQSKQSRLQGYINQLYLDAFFMKVTLNGANNDPIIGATVAMFVTSLSGDKVPAIASQLSQIGLTKQLPYIFFGLGRTNNYVRSLTVTVPIKNGIINNSWTPIIPNSQIIIVTPTQNSSKWSLQTSISPTQKISLVFWLVFLSLILIGLVIIYLTKKQKQQDKQNQQSFYAILR